MSAATKTPQPVGPVLSPGVHELAGWVPSPGSVPKVVGRVPLPGGLRPDWQITTLERVATWASGGTPPRGEERFFQGNIPWVKSGEFGPKLLKQTEERIKAEAFGCSAAKMFPKGAVGIALYGATIGKVSIWGIDASANQACAVGVPKADMLFNEYLYYYLPSQRPKLVELGKGGAQPNISQRIIR